MSVKVKPGVTWVFAPGVFRILEAMKSVSDALRIDLTVTSASDGVHSGPTDPHYTGNALDIRSHDLGAHKTSVLAGLQAELGPKFSMFLESPGSAVEHIHVQRLYGTTYTMDDYLEVSK